MSDYQPIDISRWCNAGVAAFGPEEEPTTDKASGQRIEARVHTGRQTFRGLPFLVGAPDGEPGGDCFISLRGSDAGITVRIGAKASRVIVAHTLLETTFPEDGRSGKKVAEYIFHMAGGGKARVPVRESFEIGPLPYGRGQFLAVADTKSDLLPRYEGGFGRAGWRQMESRGGISRLYYLWAWRNPDPEHAIESLEIVPAGPRFVVAAITLGHLDEHPFAREGSRPARIILTDPEDARTPVDLEVEVDRGDTTYVYALPEASTDEFIGDPYKGWGQRQNERSSPTYVEISAIPSATVAVKQGGKDVGKVNWGEVQDQGAVETPRMRFELIDPGKNWVNVTVLDEDTGMPVPCRVHFRSPDGVPYQPHGHHNHVNSNLDTFNFNIGGDVRLGQITYAYIDGTCQGWLPRGEVVVDIARGFEYEPVRTRVNIEPGQRELTLRIKRWINMNADGWYSGDSHVHFLSAQGALTESRSEDLNVVNLLQSQWGSLFTSGQEFTGAPGISQFGDNIVYVSQENRQHFLGHMILWGLKKQVMPWCSDGAGEAEIGGTLETTLSEWADRCHAQGGTVIAPHFWGLNREAVPLVATGRLDGIELCGHQKKFPHDEYYRVLNCGYKMPVVGGTDKMSSDVVVGYHRTYVHLRDGEEFGYDNWCRNVTRGRTFLSSGPIIHLTVDGHDVGDTVRISGPGTVEVEAWAESVLPIHRLDIVQAGRVVASAESQGPTRRLGIREKLKVDGHTWIAARCGSPDYFGDPDYDDMKRGIYAHTSPVYIACGGEWWMFDRGTADHMLTVIEGDIAYIRETSGQHPHGRVTHHHGEDDHIAYLERPFHEAREAIEARMRELEIAP